MRVKIERFLECLGYICGGLAQKTSPGRHDHGRRWSDSKNSWFWSPKQPLEINKTNADALEVSKQTSISKLNAKVRDEQEVLMADLKPIKVLGIQ